MICIVNQFELQIIERLHSSAFVSAEISPANLPVLSTGFMMLCGFSTSEQI